MAESPKKTLPLAFGMVMYEGDPEVVKAVLAHGPLPARILVPIIGPRLYASHAERVHGTSTPPRGDRLIKTAFPSDASRCSPAVAQPAVVPQPS
ncbi:hypothetical protein E4K10_49000 [Streptomyces sp. T1317-0309]|nr:hypothetical protein E4K10_49000 [Streptomyces sp. T1317-0309]